MPCIFFIEMKPVITLCSRSPLRLDELPSKLKGMVRNAKKAEAEITALKISYLKKLGKGSNVIIMDSSVHPTISVPVASAW